MSYLAQRALGAQSTESPFVLLTSSTSTEVFFDQATENNSIRSISSNSVECMSKAYCEAAIVHAQSNQAYYQFIYEQNHQNEYFSACLMNKGSNSGSGAFSAPRADDIAFSFAKSHSWAQTGPFTITSIDTAKNHGVMIMMGA